MIDVAVVLSKNRRRLEVAYQQHCLKKRNLQETVDYFGAWRRALSKPGATSHRKLFIGPGQSTSVCFKMDIRLYLVDWLLELEQTALRELLACEENFGFHSALLDVHNSFLRLLRAEIKKAK